MRNVEVAFKALLMEESAPSTNIWEGGRLPYRPAKTGITLLTGSIPVNTKMIYKVCHGEFDYENF